MPAPTHTFELSGLGKAPFVMVHPKKSAFDNPAWFCEHCGTTIINRHFVRSSDGKVSVVGIECLKKTGDLGLIEGQRRIKRQLKAEEREAKIQATRKNREEAERQKNNGLTNNELIKVLEEEIDEGSRELAEALHNNPVISKLNKLGFEGAMVMHAYCGQPFSKGQYTTVKEILAKKLSGSRRGSKKFIAALPAAEALLEDLQAVLVEHADQVNSIRNQIISLR